MKDARADGEAEPIKCVSGVTEDNRSYVNITCIPAVFGYEGSEPNANLMFKIGGLTNPRFRDWRSYFKMYTLDPTLRYIDETKSNDFWVEMKGLISIRNI